MRQRGVCLGKIQIYMLNVNKKLLSCSFVLLYVRSANALITDFSGPAYPWGVAGESVRIGAFKHLDLDSERLRIDALVDTKARLNKILNEILPSSSGIAS